SPESSDSAARPAKTRRAPDGYEKGPPTLGRPHGARHAWHTDRVQVRWQAARCVGRAAVRARAWPYAALGQVAESVASPLPPALQKSRHYRTIHRRCVKGHGARTEGVLRELNWSPRRRSPLRARSGRTSRTAARRGSRPARTHAR